MNVTPDSEETQSLLSRLAAGDQQAIERLFTVHRAALRRLVELRMEARLRTRVDPSDVVQEAQLDVLNRLDDYLARRPMPFRLWLRKTTYERLLKIRRRHVEADRRSTRREACLPDRSSMQLARRLVAQESTPSQVVARKELVERVQAAIAGLSETDREILLMRILESVPYEDVALILDITPAAARQRYGRALVRLNRALHGNGQDV
ncbi:MAG: sigma-70 family RNA polymerase sigma factor [Phycisphaerae bacterium]|nr:sigma-70 family RNA polymerase sigma factor [Phycisphaerae bacterium]